ncbi:hypothetical protein BDY19DRAFT_929556 [Irpex rosettiformis]|uniref:Uncharacterized protein n=1 Tax=Irpex rosettiformis TaxID=378272 RepID=A0ACB8UDE3_9APHY|nr:hypothetical protein BDY19DRAFT_929556 [Irpex rosettiformis]
MADITASNPEPVTAIRVVDTTEANPIKLSLEAALEQLRAANELLQRQKADAERDRELFRDLYNKASSHASQVSKDNEELLERVTIAEGQVKDGVTMIRKTYADRVANLELEVSRLRKMNTIMARKDAMTDGEILRRKAAEEEESRGENQRLRAELAQLRMDYNRVEGLLEQLEEEEPEHSSEQAEELQGTEGLW